MKNYPRAQASVKTTIAALNGAFFLLFIPPNHRSRTLLGPYIRIRGRISTPETINTYTNIAMSYVS